MPEPGDETPPAPPRDPSAPEADEPRGVDLSRPAPDAGRDWAVGAHLAGLSSLVGVPGVIGVLVVWLVKKDEYPLVAEHGKEALNFQISLLLYSLIGVVLALLLVGFIVLAVVFVVGLVFPILAAVKTSNGEDYRYPLTIRLID